MRLLGSADVATLVELTLHEADFGLDTDVPPAPPTLAAAQHYLSNPAVLHWVAEYPAQPAPDASASTVIGHLYCVRIPLRDGLGEELLLYEIGVREAWRRRGVGQHLLAHMQQWMDAHGVADVWVCADSPAAVQFYRACGFEIDPDQPTYLIHTRNQM